LNLTDENIAHLISTSVDSFQWLAKKKDISIKVDLESADIIMQADKVKMQTIINNLIANAIKYTPEEGQIDIQLKRLVNKERHSIQISVTDTGDGILPEELSHIFDKFYRIDDENTTSIEGTGIGLSLVKELIDLMQGSIDVRSTYGEGTSFIIELPIIEAKSTRHVIDKRIEKFVDIYKKVATTKGPNNEGSPIVLIVEDNRDIVGYLISLLRTDYTIHVAADGEEGVEKALEIIPDLIISDIMMPKKDGLTLCAELKANEKTNHVPIILLTAKAEFEDRIEGLETGADAYIMKPFKKEELLVRLRQLSELRKILQKKFSQFALIDKPDALKKENDFIHKVNSLLEDQLLNEQFGVEELSKALFMSRMQLHRKLTAMSGRSTSNYIRNYRVHKAKRLLGDRSKSISEVAWDVGFQDPNYFSKSFQKELGVTPSEFREQL
jgi:DNA-binding response OmpR family regulator/two-component sensor histidine kinase